MMQKCISESCNFRGCRSTIITREYTHDAHVWRVVMKIRPYLAGSILALTVICSPLSAVERPNMIVILCDDLNDHIGGYGGHPQASTPHLDRLRRTSVSFLNAHANNPVCGPSRASLLTGLHPHVTGYFGFDQQRNHFRAFPKLSRAVTLMEHFAQNGYHVFGTGKIFHNGHEDWKVWTGMDGVHRFGIKPNFGPFAWDGSRKRGTHDHAKGRAHPSVLKTPEESLHWDYSFGPLSDIPQYQRDEARHRPGYKGWILNGKPFRYIRDTDRDRMPDEKNAAYAADILKRVHDTPFLLLVGFNRPHTPLHAPAAYFDRFPLSNLELPPYRQDDLQDCAPALWSENRTWTGQGFRKFRWLQTHPDPLAWKKAVQAYLANVAFLDDQIGTVLEALHSSPYAENTLVIVTSDHGYHLGEKSYFFKASLWEESSRIPLIIMPPGGKVEAAVSTQPVSLIDLYPTLIDYGRLPAQPNRSTNGLSLNGYSLRPLVDAPETGEWQGPDFAIISVASNTPIPAAEPGDPQDQFYAIRTERYRYIACPDGSEELYDHQTDPNGWNNLSADPEHASLLAGMRDRLTNALEQVPTSSPGISTLQPETP